MLTRQLNLMELLGKNNSAFLFGARGVGKTKLAISFLEKKEHVLTYNLLDFSTYHRLLNNPSQISKEVNSKLESIKRLENPSEVKVSSVLTVLIDEIQKIPMLLDEVHNLIEQNKGRIQFLLTGSSARKLKREGANLLAGRALNLKLHPITHIEDSSIDVDQVLHWGTLPGIIYDNDAKANSLRSYVETYLKEEIQQEALVRKVQAFSRFLEISGQYHSKIINFTTIAKSAGVSSNTIREYFQILEDTLIGWCIYGWSASVRKQLLLAPKFYLFDNGVCNAIRGELSIEPRQGTSRYGDLFEGWIIQECIRINHYFELDLRFSYWRTNNDQEVDLIISRGAGEPLVAIEIKSRTNPEKKDLTGLISFSSDYPDVPLYCISQAPLPYEIAKIRVVNWREIGAILKGV